MLWLSLLDGSMEHEQLPLLQILLLMICMFSHTMDLYGVILSRLMPMSLEHILPCSKILRVCLITQLSHFIDHSPKTDRNNIVYQDASTNLQHYQWNGTDWNQYTVETHATYDVGDDVSIALIGNLLHLSYSRSDGVIRHSTFNDSTSTWDSPDTVDTGQFSSIIDWMGSPAIAYVKSSAFLPLAQRY